MTGFGPHDAHELIGRDRELARVGECLGPGRHRLLITGGRGAGKSRLLAAGVRRACDSHRVVTPHVSALARHLLLAFRRDLPGLPGAHGPAALALLGLDGQQPTAVRPEPRDLPDISGLVATGSERPGCGGDWSSAATASVVRGVLTAVSRSGPVLVAVDDVHRLDRDGAELLTAISEVTSVLLTGAYVPAGLADLPTLELEPLGVEHAARLLDAQDRAPTGRARAEILHRAAGNPATVVELAADRHAGGRLQAAFAAEIAALPEPTRGLLLHLAAATPPVERARVTAAAGLPDGDCWTPAERAGLVVVDADAAIFTHPLAAEAAYRSVPIFQRRQAHRNLTMTVAADSERRAQHLAAATSGPDERIAAGLEAAAAVFRDRDALFEAAAAMQEAAQRTPEPADAARRFAQAAVDARNLGEPDWTGELYGEVRRLSGDPDDVNLAAHAAATALTRAGRQNEAYALVAGARRVGPPTDSRIGEAMIGLAAVIAVMTGDEKQRRALEPIPSSDPLIAAFARMVRDPSSGAGIALCDATAVPEPGAALSRPERHRLNVIGTIAGYRDRTRLAAGLLRATVDAEPRARSSVSGVEALPSLVAALIDTGEWATAERYADAAGFAGLPVLAAGTEALRAQLHALRGEVEPALRLVRRAVGRVDIHQHRTIGVRLLRAESLAATAGGDYENAYRYLRSMFDRDGRPLHPFLSGRHVAELTAAAIRCGRGDDARRIIDGVRASAGPSARMALLLHLARALLGDGEDHFVAATADPAGDEWPYERAVARLHYGEWLRRARRPRDARVMLSAAARTFTGLGATHSAELANRELGASSHQDGLTGVLTHQERQVAHLAARGLRNREIAEQLFISVRTVGAHLHSVYPKLGINGRHQLREVFSERSSEQL
ncbi:helix-turn-helix transcriptional regulator [Actinoplanes solisilvae]|uniref:helix-turn-helix transcriptional regulator n=1 Tax=Actinoplanes solisilvae TaxID=2486853 RepID=UPI000FD8947A|nr:LuxR family transcriptional regulator [Actinoplanes solisilvae]